jgi:hypothetical protein
LVTQSEISVQQWNFKRKRIVMGASLAVNAEVTS